MKNLILILIFMLLISSAFSQNTTITPFKKSIIVNL